jgi:GT2 family glycosyltransferase
MSGYDHGPGRVEAIQFCPWEHFDAEWYAATYMRKQNPEESADPFEHYCTTGAANHHSPNPYFDEAWYLARNADAREMVADGRMPTGFAHYCAIGCKTHDPHWLFKDGIYRARRGDLTPGDLASNGLRNGYHHYLIAGQNEQTSGSSFFDPKVVEELTGITDKPFTALVTAPWLGQVRLSNFFDPEWYLAMYEEVEDLIADGYYGNPLHHYLANPTPERYAGSADFDEAFYSTRYPDIGEAIRSGHLRTGYQHFVDYGRFEDRQPSPWFDPHVYKRHPQVKAALKRQPDITAFEHFVRTGRRIGLPSVAAAQSRPIHERPGQETAGKDIFLRMAHLWANAATPVLVRFQQPAMPDVSVVMCAFNQYDLTIQTLLHLSGSTGVSFEVILIDNASIDDTRFIEKRVEGLKLIRNATNQGFLHASNAGIKAARGRAVLLLNNDVILPPNAIELALKRLESDDTVGAVGGKVVRTHGLLQEAGSILFSNGSAMGYGRDHDPFEPDFDFVRDVDYCSGVFLMLRRDLLTELGGLDTDYAPAYYEETDLCVRVWKAGLRVVYDPTVVIVHLEFGSARNPDAPRALMRRNREILVSKHRDWLAAKMVPDAHTAVNGRTATRRPRVLFIEDTIPYRHIGSGFVRSADVVESLVDLGCDVTVYPMNPVERPANYREGFDETVELLWNRDITHIPAFFAERKTYYDIVWVCRAHNLHRLASTVGHGSWGPLVHARVVLDTEALAANREAASAELHGRNFNFDRALKRELRQAYLVQEICCVNAMEQAQLIKAGLPRVHVLGHAVEPRPSKTRFAERRDILALGSLYGVDTPNFDGLRWFIDAVWPLVLAELGDVRLIIAGFVAEGLDAAGLLAGANVVHMGFVADSAALYEQARVFLAPTRFAAGIPFKVHEAASYGVPVMATQLLADQLGWEAGTDLMACPPDDSAAFAEALVAVYSDAAKWQSVRDAALDRIVRECGRAQFTGAIKDILQLVE